MSRSISRGYNTLVLSTDVTWGVGSTAATPKNIDITIPDVVNGDNLYLVLVANPSTYSDLTAKAQVAWVDSSTTTRYGLLTSWAVANSSGNGALVQGMLTSTAARLTLSNDAALSTSVTATAYIKIYTI